MDRNMLAALLVLACWIAAPAACAAPLPGQLHASDAEIATFFDSYIADTMRELDLPGGAAVVVRDGAVIFARGYGYADLASERPVDVERSLFRAASISKLIPWLLVMQLVEEGRLDLDRDIAAYLDFPVPEGFGRPITMRHLMTHTAGLPERFHGVFDPDLSTPLGQTLRENFPERVHPAGSTVAYSNFGAALAGYIVERLHGQPWEDIVRQRVFAPIGMHHATVAQPAPPSMQAALVQTYPAGSYEPVQFRTTPLAPMGSLTASAADMGRLLAMIANGGEGAHGRILARATLQRMQTLQQPLGPGLHDGLGLGFLVGSYRGVRYAGHAGNMSTLATDLELLPDHGLGWYYVFSSQGPGERARKVRDALLRAVIDRFVVPLPATPQAHGPSSATDVAGDYISTRRLHSGPLMFSGLMNTTRASAEDDGTLTIDSSGTVTHWLPAGRDRFVDAASGIPLAVTRGRDGRVLRIASAALYPVAEFERAPGYLAAVPWVAMFVLATLLLATVARPVAWGMHRWRAGRGTIGAAAPDTAALRIRRWARRSFWLLMATVAGWAALGLALAIDFSVLFGLPWGVRALLAALTLLSGPAAAVILLDAVLALRDPRRGWPARVAGLLLAAAAIGLAWLLYVFEVASFSADW